MEGRVAAGAGMIGRPMVVSPHLDDAVLSCGQYLAGFPQQTVVTVCAGLPDDQGLLTQYDADSGFVHARSAMVHRRAEDQVALQLLDQDGHHLLFRDEQYRGGAELDVDQVVGALVQLVASLQAPRIVGPVGLCHPDHVAVAAACRAAARVAGVELWVYEELPYRVLDPGAAVTATVLRGYVGPEFIGTGDLARKAEAVACYRSQVWALDMHCLLVPERFWKVPT